MGLDGESLLGSRVTNESADRSRSFRVRRHDERIRIAGRHVLEQGESAFAVVRLPIVRLKSAVFSRSEGNVRRRPSHRRHRPVSSTGTGRDSVSLRSPPSVPRGALSVHRAGVAPSAKILVRARDRIAVFESFPHDRDSNQKAPTPTQYDAS